MMIAKDILVHSIPSVEGLPPVPWQNIKFRPRALAKANSSVYMIKSVMSSGHDNSSKPKATKSRPILSTKTIWALFCWQRMAMSPVLKGPNISRQNTSSFVITTIQEKLIFNIVLPSTCGQTFEPNLSKVPSFASCVLSWWIAQLFILKTMVSPIPTSLPTSSKTKISSSSPKHNQPFVPLDEPTDIPMKKRSLQPTPSLQGCVEIKSHGTNVPSPSHKYEYTQKNVTWKDALFPRHQASPSQSPHLFPHHQPSPSQSPHMAK